MSPSLNLNSAPKQYCDSHTFNTAEINKHRGLWKFVITYSGIFTLLLVSFGVWQVQQTQALRVAVSTLVAVSAEQAKTTNLRLARLEDPVVKRQTGH